MKMPTIWSAAARRCLLFVVALWGVALGTPALASPKTNQIVTTSWPGLSGLYIIPTARIIGRKNFGIGFNESKHTEFREGLKYTDRQIRGVATYGVSDHFEIGASYYNDMYVIPPGEQPQLSNRTFSTFALKYLVMEEHPRYWFPAVAVGVRDLTNNTRNVGPLIGVNNGTTGFLVVSKRMLKNEEIGRFMDVHAGLSFNAAEAAGFTGFELTLTTNASLIAEGVWNSPYLNFKDFGHNYQAGRYLFNVGIRMYPELVQGLVLDTGFVGDGEFEFSFGASYVMNL